MDIKTELSFGARNVESCAPKFLLTRRELLLPLALVAALLGGCAIGNTYEYRLPRMPLPVEGNGSIGLAVTDQRSYILSGDKEPDFVGLQRGGYGNPFNVTTTSGRPMAEDIADTLKIGLTEKGFRVVSLTTPADDPAALGRAATERGLRRVVGLQIKEWKTDTMMRTKLVYELQLLIVSPDGEVVARNAVSGSDAIGGGMPAAIGALAQQSLESKIGQLFYPPEIQAGLGDVDYRSF